MIYLFGADAIDYDIVESLNLTNLMQKNYFSVSVPDECCVNIDGELIPSTLLCWESIITGNKPKESKKVYENDTVENIRKKIGIYLGFIKGKRLLLEKLGLKYYKKTKPSPSTRKLDSIFNLFPHTIDFNVPTYSKEYAFNPFMTMKDKLLQTKIMLEFADSEFNLVKSFSLLSLKKEFDLLMVYSRLLDWYGHYCYGTKAFYYRYKLVDLFIKEFYNKFPGIIIIISDHGMKDGEHTREAFFSINIKIDKPNSLYDIYDVVNNISDE